MNATRSLVPAEVSAWAKPYGRIPFAFGPRFFVAMLLGLLWLVPAWWIPRLVGAMLLWDLLALLAFAVDLLRLPAPNEIEGRRSWEHAPSLATKSDITIHLWNQGRVAIRCTAVDEASAALRNSLPPLSLIVAAKQQSSIKYSIVPRERGDVRLGRCFVRYQSPLGFAERWSVIDLSQTVRILPDLEQAKQQALYLIRSRQVEMEKRRRKQRGQGREFESLREYRQGDEFRDICWTATARRHQLTTRLFEIERSQAVWIVLDAGRLLRAEVQTDAAKLRLAKLDFAVNAALSLAQVAIQCGDRVGLLAYGRTIQQNIGTGRGPAHLRSIVDALAQVHSESGEANHSGAAKLLLTEQSRRSLVVWITDFAETPTMPDVIEHAMHMARRHLVVFSAMNQPDLSALAHSIPKDSTEMYRHAAALEIVQRRESLLRGLRQQGVFAFELAPGLLAGSMVNQYLEIKERNLL